MIVHEPSVTTSTPEALAIPFNQWHVHINDFVFKIKLNTIWDVFIEKYVCYITKTSNIQGDLTDVSAETKTLVHMALDLRMHLQV